MTPLESVGARIYLGGADVEALADVLKFVEIVVGVSLEFLQMRPRILRHLVRVGPGGKRVGLFES